NTAQPGEQVLTGDNVTLEAGRGGIASANEPLGIHVRDELEARAKEAIYLTQMQGDLPLDRLFSQSGRVAVTVEGGGLFAAYARPASGKITPSAIAIDTARGVGCEGQRLTLASGDGDVGLDVGGDAWLQATNPGLWLVDGSVGSTLDLAHIATLTIDGVITVGSDWRAAVDELDMQADSAVRAGRDV